MAGNQRMELYFFLLSLPASGHACPYPGSRGLARPCGQQRRQRPPLHSLLLQRGLGAGLRAEGAGGRVSDVHWLNAAAEINNMVILFY